jgi:type IV pilus assembly protein PilQ
MKKIILIIMLLPLLLFAEDKYYSAGDLVSMRSNLSFKQAMMFMNVHVREAEGKILVDMSGYSGPIKVDIDKLHWKLALNTILKANFLRLDVVDNAWVINKIAEFADDGAGAEDANLRDPSIPDVMIEITFFEADRDILREMGIDWSTYHKGEVNFNSNMNTKNNVTDEILKLTFEKTFNIGNGKLDVTAMFDAFEATDKGHILSRPQITVTSGGEGMVQDGEDFSIKQIDEDGNTTDNFYSAGTIIKVKPEVITTADGERVIYMDVEAERSSASPDVVSTVVKKNKTKTTHTLFNGEEKVISGLTSKEVKVVRKGVPFLKNLPWWFLGLRYVFGYEKNQTITKELLVIIKASVVPTIEERKQGRPRLELDVKNIRRSIPAIEKKLVE